MWVALRLPLVALALFLTPHLLALSILPRRRIEALLPLSGPLAIILNVGLLLAFHAASVQIAARFLAPAHLALAAFALAFAVFRHGGNLRALLEGVRWEHPEMGMAAALFALLVFPFTDFVGIDTYKWQDLATAIRMEGNVPWVIHPLSVFGFSPRAYPVAQPCLLATAQILGALGVDPGFYAVSLLCGLTGLGGAYALARRLLPDNSRFAVLLAVLYVFSPVFLRYAHWATGRGFCLALLPLYIALLLQPPRPRTVAGALVVAILLATTHKAGAVAAILLPLLHLLGCLPAPRRRSALLAASALSALASIAFAPRLLLPGLAGRALGAVRFALTRFGVLLPPALAGCALGMPASSRERMKRLVVPTLLLLPPAFHPEMYPAMLFLPYACAFAAVALSAAPPVLSGRAGRVALLCAVAFFALATIGHRLWNAAPSDVRITARLLEAYDPRGPYTVTAEHRRQIQAYVSGFARFSVEGDPRVSVSRPPPFEGPPSRMLEAMINWLRNAAYAGDVGVDWYGKSPRHYYVVVKGQGPCPRDAIRVAAEGDVVIYRDAASPPPPEPRP
jgi:hypothetical protein